MNIASIPKTLMYKAVCVQEMFTHRENILEFQDKAGSNMGKHHGEAHERNHLENFVSQHQVDDERNSSPLIRRLSNLEMPEGWMEVYD
jgi:hypothetical protein